jgi:hypothetical protein
MDLTPVLFCLLICPQVNDNPVCVCVLGWGPSCLMNDLIKELDHGVSKLPRGSEVDFVNMHNPHDSLGLVLQHVSPERIKVRSIAHSSTTVLGLLHSSPCVTVFSRTDTKQHHCLVRACRCGMWQPTPCSAAPWPPPWTCPSTTA